MAQNVIINGVTYQSVPSVDIPKVSGGTAKFYDTAAATPSASDVRNGVKVFGADGEVQGNLTEVSGSTQNITTKAQVFTAPAGIHAGDYKVQISASEQGKIVSGNIKSGVTILGVQGSLSSVSVSQDSSTKVLSIS